MNLQVYRKWRVSCLLQQLEELRLRQRRVCKILRRVIGRDVGQCRGESVPV
jgi:hypothetical protein